MTRGQRRLRIAAGLMRLPNGADVMAAINQLPVEKRQHLKELVDWVEDYERQEAMQ